MNNLLSKQIEKYQEQLRNMNVMDDYEGGAANQLRMVIDDLRKLEARGNLCGNWRDKDYLKKIKKDS